MLRTYKDYSLATIVCVYMGITGNAAVSQLLQTLPSHIKVVSHSYRLEGWEPVASVAGTHDEPTADGGRSTYKSSFDVYLYHPPGPRSGSSLDDNNGLAV